VYVRVSQSDKLRPGPVTREAVEKALKFCLLRPGAGLVSQSTLVENQLSANYGAKMSKLLTVSEVNSLDQIQELALSIYGRYDVEKSLIWMVEEIGEVVAAIRKGKSKEEILGEIGDLSAWVVCLCNILELNLSDAISGTFQKEVDRQLRVYGRFKYDTGSLRKKHLIERGARPVLRIGLPKGGVIQHSLKLMGKCLNKEIDSNALNDIEGQYCFYLLKHRDIPRLVEDGVLDIGVTSSEWVEEVGADLSIIKNLDWCDTRISLISHRDMPVLEHGEVRCVTEFANIAKNYFKKVGLQNAQIDNISGSSESFVPSIYNCCVDCVETGATLQLHDLVEESVILRSKTVVVARKPNNGPIHDAFVEVLSKGL
jgi:ATP phosphoribosyltransferase